MNRVVLLGRLTKDIELRKTKEDMSVARFTLAIPRIGGDNTDFINCIAFKGKADTLEKYVKKGNQICIEGRIQTGSYEAQDGTKRYTTDIVVDNFSFVGTQNSTQSETQSTGNENIIFDEVELGPDDLPF